MLIEALGSRAAALSSPGIQFASSLPTEGGEKGEIYR